MSHKIFDNISRKYALSKTLRFELASTEQTLKNLKIHNILTKDEKKEKAYHEIKPLFDELHNIFITESLEKSQISWEDYIAKYSRKTEENKKELENIEKNLREEIGKLFAHTGEYWKSELNKNFSKPVLKDKWYKILTEAWILHILREKYPDKKEFIDEFDGFFTYFSGFNQNRENYYTTKEEKSTAIATRIVHENLPKFCGNKEIFEKKKDSYLSIYEYLKNLGKILQIKWKSGEMENLYPITEDIFESYFFNSCLSQNGIDEYNRIIGHYNELINLYNQNNSSEKLSHFKTLYKQIGSKWEKTFEIFSLENTDAMRKLIEEKYIPEIAEKHQKIKEIFQTLNHKTWEDFSKIFLSKNSINTISAKIFSNWMTISEKMIVNKIWKQDNNWEVIIPEYTSMSSIFNSINNEKIEEIFKEEKIKNLDISTANPSEIFLKILQNDIETAIIQTQEYQKELLKILPSFDKEKSEHKEILKNFADESRIPFMMLKYFLAKKIHNTETDSEFYNDIDAVFQDCEIFTNYDPIRNFITKKIITSDKMKLNFENGTLAGGWDVNKESANSCVILLDENNHEWLAIMTKWNNQVFQKEVTEWKWKNKIIQKNPLYNEDSNWWKKMEYKLLPWPNKMLPKCLIPWKEPQKYGATDEILEIYKSGSFKKSEKNFSKNSLYKMIDFYKESLPKYEDWKVFDFQFKKTEEYEDISQFYSDVEIQWYKLDFVNINKTELQKLENEEKIFLFQIKNRDYNKANNQKKDSNKNLHTLYWQAIFSNLENKPKLNGEAELFFRKASQIIFKKDENGKEILNKKDEKIIEKIRYTRDKFLFHVPITLNFCLKENNINEIIKNLITENDNIKFLGIDRGEKHLLYYSLTDKNGKILEQWSLNEFFDGKKYHNYHEKLTKISENRDKARKSWQTIGTIKEMKEGYISQAVKKITDLAIEYSAIIVMEDLNTGFKRGRQKIEKSIYQKFELALAKKLNFVVLKNTKNNEIGSINNAYQLTPKVENYGDIENKKQIGIIFYTRANYTSQTDPATWWRKSIYIRKGVKNIKNDIIENFWDIYYENWEYIFEYIDKNEKRWKMYTKAHGKVLERYYWYRNKENNIWENKLINAEIILDEILKNFDKNRSILAQIEEWIEPTSWEKLRFAIEIISQIRNSGNTEKDNDFLLSPIRDENGKHFDSRYYLEKISKETDANNIEKPVSGDANGAYNIARKWIIMAEHIRQDFKNNSEKDLSLYIPDQEWDLWLNNQEKWKNELSIFASKKAMEKQRNKK